MVGPIRANPPMPVRKLIPGRANKDEIRTVVITKTGIAQSRNL